jgi:hypothetical protein
MAGRVEGLSGLEWNLFADIFPPERQNAGEACPIPRSARPAGHPHRDLPLRHQRRQGQGGPRRIVIDRRVPDDPAVGR